jgi:hypothetical protein
MRGNGSEILRKNLRTGSPYKSLKSSTSGNCITCRLFAVVLTTPKVEVGRARRWYRDRSWRSELQMVKNVEKFRPEINPHPFSVGQYKVFDQCEVRVDEIRTVVEVNPRFTQKFVD